MKGFLSGLTAIVFGLMLAPQPAFALTEGSTSTDSIAIAGILYLALIWAYPVNKWRRWRAGFSRGRARQNVFGEAMKWTLIASILSAIPAGAILIYYAYTLQG
ncbi:MAG: hypothetical protein EOM91_19285 [Sphingobacteriia bacterium]|nr:hypothetical protein [Sphingobacteriia bacterium]